ncbi:hypothetical protein [Desulfatiglans anilini]|uniref:hypothetical protein n=1 Tax=Desulfatiglans anilini TaxID=90728 RepID=UPI0003FCDAE2|nr:hypothetical protein [Desulfatiglans anilini]
MSAVRKSVLEQGPYQLEVIQCTRQPGSLRITKRACALRYRMAQKDDLKIPNDEYGMARRSGLDICRKCPIGRRFSKTLANQLDSEESKRRVAIPFQKEPFDIPLEELS